MGDPNFAPMYAMRTRKVKTDRRDARALKDACVLGAYRPAHGLSDPQCRVRGRLTVRDSVVRTRTRSISLIRALLRQQGYRVPSGSAEAFDVRVSSQGHSPTPGAPFPDPLRVLRSSREEFSMTATSGSDCAAAAAIGGSQPVAASSMPTTL